MITAILLIALSQGVTQDAIVIGMEAEAYSFSVDEENLGMRLVIHHVNDTGGIHGRRLEIRAYDRDPADSVASSVANARRLVEEDGVFLLFNFGGPAAVQIGAYAMANDVPYLFPHTALLTVDGDRHIYTSFPRYEGESATMLRYLVEERGAKRIGIIHAPNIYGDYFRNRAADLAGELDYVFAGAEALENDAPSAAAQVTAIRALNPDTLVMALYPAGARRVVDAKAALGWDVRLVSSGPLTDEQYLNMEGHPAEGTLGLCHYPDPNESDSPGVREYRRLMSRYFPDHPLNRYSLYGYVFGSLVVEGLRRAGPSLSEHAFLDAMESIRDWDSGGILPPVSFSPDDHHAQKAGFICELENGRFRPITDWIEP